MRPAWREVVAASPFPRVVATDLDGTLLDARGEVTSRTLAALRGFVASGGEYVLVTARPPRWLRPLADLVPAGGVVLAGNGAFEVDVAQERVVRCHAFAAAQVARMLRDLRAAFADCVLAVETTETMAYEPGPAATWHDPEVPVPDLAAWVEDTGAVVGKILAMLPGAGSRDSYDAVSAVVGARGVPAFSGAPGLVEIGPPGVSKACALERWCAERGVGREGVWAFGDMPNDLPMLRWAGLAFGVANAHPDVLDAVDAVAPHHAEHGVAQVLEAALKRRLHEGREAAAKLAGG